MPGPPKEELLKFETALFEKGFSKIAGLDEAGRGPLAGPVVAAAVLFEEGVFIEGVWDSKKISEKKREILFDEICTKSASFGIGIVHNEKIDEINIYEATKLAMMNAIDHLHFLPDFLLIDAMKLSLDIPQNAITKGDQKSFSIAAASILAKVTRDRIMMEMHEEFPIYGWNKNKGYPTREHRNAVKKYGHCKYHRKSFKIS